MDYIWDDDYEDELLQAVKAALNYGAPAKKVQQLVASAAECDLGYVPGELQRTMAEALGPDGDVGGGQTFLHQLFKQVCCSHHVSDVCMSNSVPPL